MARKEIRSHCLDLYKSLMQIEVGLITSFPRLHNSKFGVF